MDARYVRRAELVGALAELALPGDLVLVLGAGDITHAAPELLAFLDRAATAGSGKTGKNGKRGST